jgi:hypothetical protein
MKNVADIWQACRTEDPKLGTELPTPEVACSEDYASFAEALAEAYALGELIESDWFHQFILLKPSAFYASLEFQRLLELSLKKNMRAGMKARMSKSERFLPNLEEPALESVGEDRKSKIKFQLSSNGLPRFAFAAPILEEKARAQRKKRKKIIIYIILIIIALSLIYISFFIR